MIVAVDTRKATICNTDLLTSGSAGIEVTFRFSADWDDLSKIAVFKGSGISVDVVLTDSTCVIPAEALAQSGLPLHIGVYGTDGSGAVIIPTIWANAGTIRAGAKPGETTPIDPTPTVVDQILAAASEAVDTANEAIDVARDAQDSAAASAESAYNSAQSAGSSAGASAASASTARASASAAGESADAAAASAAAAAASESNASQSAQTAAQKASAASASASNAGSSAASAGESASAALSYMTAAQGYAQHAEEAVAQGGYISSAIVDEQLVFTITNFDNISFGLNDERLEVIYG